MSNSIEDIKADIREFLDAAKVRATALSMHGDDLDVRLAANIQDIIEDALEALSGEWPEDECDEEDSEDWVEEFGEGESL